MTHPTDNVEVVMPEGVVPTGRVWFLLVALQLIVLAISVFILVMSFVMQVIGDGVVMLPGGISPLPEACTSKLLFGVSCPGCGLTRAMISLSSGEFERAWAFNPASFLLYPFLVVQIPWRLFQTSRLFRGRHVIYSDVLWVPILTIVCGLILQWLLRLF